MRHTNTVPPEKVLMLDERGAHIPSYILGPYNEDSSINITCVSIGGKKTTTKRNPTLHATLHACAPS